MGDLQQLYLDLLGHESDSVREEAVKHLLEMLDSEVLEALLQYVEDASFPGQLEAIWLLGKSEETRVTETLLRLFESPDAQVREVVAGAFAEIGDVRALQPLIDALQDESGAVKDAAAIALGELRDSRAVEPLIAKLADTDTQQVASWALALIGDRRAIPPLQDSMVNDEDASMRAMAARALGKMSLPEADQALPKALDDDDEGVLIESIRVMGERHLQDTIPLLEERFQTTEIERVQLACAVALARLGLGEKYFDYLTRVMEEDEDWGARLSAVMGLREMDYEQVEAPLRQALDDTHWLVQKAAARSLLYLHDEELYTTLEVFLGDEEEDIMQAVIESSFFEMLEIDPDAEDDEAIE